ncbi:MAG TPA: hypothetical protein VE967_19925 [Gemmatimonadaceae bacterium]|nr:hypothetical protein [Gemmatimonadaceae bacterium]
MNGTVDRLVHLAALLERARETAVADDATAIALLDEATGTLRAIPALHESDPDADAIKSALSAAHVSYVALQQALRDELGRISRELARMSAGAEAAVRYAPRRETARQLDRVG